MALVVVAWVSLWWARNNPKGYKDRTKGRVELWAKCLDDVDTILNTDSDKLPVGALIRVEGKLDGLADAQRRERVPDVGLELMNARTARLFEIERNVIKDLRTTGGKNVSTMGQERTDLLMQLGLEDVMRARNEERREQEGVQ